MFIENRKLPTSSLYERAGDADMRPPAEAANEKREGLLLPVPKLAALEQSYGLADLPGGDQAVDDDPQRGQVRKDAPFPHDLQGRVEEGEELPPAQSPDDDVAGVDGRGQLGAGDGPVEEVDDGGAAEAAAADGVGEELRGEGVEARGGEGSVEGGAAGGLLEEDPAEAVRGGEEERGGGRRRSGRGRGSWIGIGVSGVEGSGGWGWFVGGEEADGGDDRVLGGGGGGAEATEKKAAGHFGRARIRSRRRQILEDLNPAAQLRPPRFLSGVLPRLKHF